MRANTSRNFKVLLRCRHSPPEATASNSSTLWSLIRNSWTYETIYALFDFTFLPNTGFAGGFSSAWFFTAAILRWWVGIQRIIPLVRLELVFNKALGLLSSPNIEWLRTPRIAEKSNMISGDRSGLLFVVFLCWFSFAGLPLLFSLYPSPFAGFHWRSRCQSYQRRLNIGTPQFVWSSQCHN